MFLVDERRSLNVDRPMGKIPPAEAGQALLAIPRSGRRLALDVDRPRLPRLGPGAPGVVAQQVGQRSLQLLMESVGVTGNPSNGRLLEADAVDGDQADDPGAHLE